MSSSNPTPAVAHQPRPSPSHMPFDEHGRYVDVLDGSGARVEDVGGKAAALDALVAAGFPVPTSLAVTAEAYRAFVAHNRLELALDDLAGRAAARGPGPDPLEIERTFTTAPMPDDLADEVLAAVSSLLGDVPLAVRSSATSEDTETASFAGQYASEIGVSPHEVLTAVKRVWSSLWAPAVVAYRAQLSIDDSDLAMGVLVMPVVPAELAGVAFTVDPGGTPDHLRVELVRGLAEGLVSGRTTPEVLVVPRDPPRHLTEELVDVAHVVERVVELALEAEAYAGTPQDVEWVAVGGEVQLVQARPITVAEPEAPDDDDGFDTPALPGVTYTAAGIAEMLPGVLPPLQWTIAGPLIEEAFRDLLDDLGVLPEDLTGAHGVLGRFRGRAALNLDLLKATARRVPGGSAAEMERQYFGHSISDDGATPEDGATPDDAGAGANGDAAGRDDRSPAAPKTGRLQTLRTLRRILGLYRRTNADSDVVVRAVELVARSGTDLAALSDRDLLSHLSRLEQLGSWVAVTQVRAAAAAAATYRGLEVMLERHVGPAAEVAAQRITTGALSSSETGVVTPSPDLARTASMASFGGPTWDEGDPEGRWQPTLQQAPRDEESPTPEEALAELETQLTHTWHWQVVRVLTGQVIDVRRRMLRRLTSDARELLARREATKAALLLLGGQVRRTTLEIGARLHGRGSLQDPSDVSLLGREELNALAPDDERTAPGLPSSAELDRRRKALARAEEMGPLPRRFDARPGPAVAGADEGGVLRGWGASPGRHTGPVLVVSDPRNAEVKPGDVLVANNTDPSWTPLFLQCGAVVVEEGGPLSHAAIIARELGLPAVLNCPGATRLAEGTEVTVDGQAGTVEIVGERAPPGGPP